jgi:hypothetical protein
VTPIGLARQIATLPLQRGKLTVVETKSIPAGDRLGNILAETLPEDDSPDWVWIHEGSDRRRRIRTRPPADRQPSSRIPRRTPRLVARAIEWTLNTAGHFD